MRDDLRKRSDENREQYIYRIYSNKIKNQMINKDCAEVINKELGTNFQESYLRGIFVNYSKGFDEGYEKALSSKEGSKLDEIKEELGELFVANQELRNKTRKLTKLKRDLVKTVEISNDIKSVLKEEVHNFEQLNYKPIITESENKLVILLSDWHIGYVINDYKGNSFNYNIAQDRLSKLLGEVRKTCEIYNISEVVVANAGDTIEGLYMRENQSYDCEFNLSEQIVMATKLLYGFCTSVSDFANVGFVSVGGNHMRSSGIKNANVEGDNANVIIVETFKEFINISNNNRIEVLETDFKDDSATFNLCGKNIKLIHGDNRVKQSKKLFDAEATIDEEFYYLILRGHFHNFSIESQNGGYVVTNGCLFGYNPYSVKRMSCSTKASQSLIVINNNGIELIKNVELQ